jgi:hypothetical protein
MKKIIVIAIVVAVGWYGNHLYKQYGSAFVQNSSTDSVHKNGVKCITKNGSVIYGSVPQGTVCERVESIEGSLTVVPGQTPRQFDSSSKENSSTNSKCDGRIHCSQMKSCDEATFFLRNCPGVKMDGDNDGIPCENQWCG